MKSLAALLGVVALSAGFAACVPDLVQPTVSSGSGGDDVGGGSAGSGSDTTPTTPPAPGDHIGFVLAHGLGGDVNSFDPAIVAALQADGYYVLRTQVPGVESVAVRAAALGPQIDKFIADNQLTHVHIIAHSMGGLDARYLISTMGYASKIESLTTMSTPHRGSPLADAALGLTNELPSKSTSAIANAFGFTADPAALQRALVDLSEAQAPAFNAANPDAPNVHYYSYAGYSTEDGITNPNAAALCGADTSPSALPNAELEATGAIIATNDVEPHDGVVPIESSKWTGFQGCIPTDHLDMTRAGEEPSSNMKLDLVALYTKIAHQASAGD